MKPGYIIRKVEYCTPPNIIEVVNIPILNTIEMYMCYDFQGLDNNSDTVGIWKIKYKNNSNV